MSLRNERLKEVIREEAAEVILQHLTDPRIGFCTVTRIDLTNDLAYCTIHVSVLGDAGDKSRTMHGLKDARGLIQSRIAKRLKTRTTPHVKIELDESIEKSFSVLNKIKEARASDSDGGRSTSATDGDDASPGEEAG
ncbi:MAG TPA: 30S ribosome-binding factor RbfA [Planctomycetota bacterium]|nr:30S ribosome-binding factor RbfA [Planctomycetota bacterium]